MADPNDPHASRPSHSKVHTTTGHEGGNGWKWLLGAGAAAALVGIGYVVLNDNKTTPSNEIAYNDATSSNADRYAGPLPGDERSPADVAETSSDDVQTASATPTPTPRRERARAATTTPTPEPVVIEQTVGVGSDGVVAENASYDEEVIVHQRLRPQWTRTPSARRMTAAYPERALERGREGEARVACTVLDTGRLDCARVSEYPANYGFGNAAVRVAEQYRHDAVRADGLPAAGTPVNFRVLFRVAEERHASLN
ncbi:MAG: TonB family protein [Terricaulis sp.]